MNLFHEEFLREERKVYRFLLKPEKRDHPWRIHISKYFPFKIFSLLDKLNVLQGIVKTTIPLEEYYEKADKLFKIEITEKTGTMAKEAADIVIEKINK